MASEEEILAAEAERKALWDRVASHLRALAEMGCGGIVNSREALVILEHIAGLEALVVRLASETERQMEKNVAALQASEEIAAADERTIHRLRYQLGEAQRERDEARAEREAALARLSEPRPSQDSGVVVIELGVRLGVRVCGA